MPTAAENIAANKAREVNRTRTVVINPYTGRIQESGKRDIRFSPTRSKASGQDVEIPPEEREGPKGTTKQDVVIEWNVEVKDGKLFRSVEQTPKQQQQPGARENLAIIDQARASRSTVSGTYTEAPQPKGFLEKTRSFIQRSKFKGQREGATIKEKGAGIVSEVATPFIETGIFAKELIKSPRETAVATGAGIVSSAKDPYGTGYKIGQTIRQEPGRVVGEVLFLKGASKVIEGSKTAVDIGRTVLSPKFRPVGLTESGARIVTTPSSAGEVSFEITGALTKGKPRPTTLTGELGTFQLRTTPLTSLPKQADLAGKEVIGVSGARDLFGRVFNQEVLINKPGTPPIERSFFIDPGARLRPSRLNIEPQSRAGLTDLVSGEFTFFRERPQAILFPTAKIEAFPSRLRGVERSLKTGRGLTSSQEKRLLEFQLTPSGQFKPIGKLSSEIEATLPPGEILRSRGTVGVTLIGGRRVSIIEAEIKQGSRAFELGEEIKFTRSTRSTRSSRPSSSRPYQPLSEPLSSGLRVGRSTSLKIPSRRSISKSIGSAAISIPSRSPTIRSPTSGFPSLPSGRISSPISTPPFNRPIYSPPSRPPSYIPPLSPPTKLRPPFIPGKKEGRISTKTINKRLKREFEYQPSLGATLGNVKGKRPGVLTGLELRPL